MDKLNIRGIDISNYQGIFNFNLLKESNIEVVIIETSDGITFTNPYLDDQYSRAINSGLKIGFYHFFRAEDNCKLQAQHFWNQIKDKKFDVYPILDVEVNMGIENLTSAVIDFLEEFEKLSKLKCIIYSYTNFIELNFDDRLENCYCWIADYGVNSLPKTIFKDYVGWQYTDSGNVKGLSNDFDMDLFSNEIYLKNKYIGNIIYNKKEPEKLWQICVHGQIVKNLQYELDIQFKADLIVDGWFGEKTLSSCVDVGEGAIGNITKVIQDRLIDKGFSCGSYGIDGDFGPDTLNAVKEFQKYNNLLVDGIVGKNTWKALMLL